MPDAKRFLCEAIELARENVRKGGRPFGAVLVKDGQVLDGFAGALLRRHARRGSLDARLMTDRQLRADPFATYDAIRERGLISQGPFGYVSASHSVCGTGALRPTTGRRRCA